MEISFYHLTTLPVEKALPRLLEKAYDSGHRVLVVANDNDIKKFDDNLWTFHPQKFLPHGIKDPGRQPIFISANSQNQNSASVIAITNGTKLDDFSGYEKILDIFDGNYPDQLSAASERYKLYKSAGVTIRYWQQDDKGNWKEVA